MKSFDVVVVGGGHNGLAAATKLARAGRRVAVYEATDAAGGMLGAREIAPGFRVSRAAHLVHRLDNAVVADLRLADHGLVFTDTAVPTVLLSDTQPPLTLRGAWGESMEGPDSGEAAKWQALRKRLILQAEMLRRFDGHTPVQPGHASLRQKLAIATAGLRLRASGTREFRQFLRMALMCVADIAEEALTDDRLKGLAGFDATLGIRLGPRSPGSVIGLYHRLAGDTAGIRGALGAVRGGMGALAAAFVDAARAAGVEIHTGRAVEVIELDKGKARGIRLAGGERVGAGLVLSAVSPVATFLDLVGPRNLDTGFVREIRSLRHMGNVAKLNLALSSPPRFSGVGNLAARFVHAPSIRHVEDSFNPQKYGELPPDPPFEMVVESAFDSALAPDGGAVVSIIVANVPHDLKEGWEAGRPILMRSLMTRLESLSPGIGKTVVASELLAPPDLGALFNAPGGHWHHLELQADRLYALRPVFGAAAYRAPVDGLYLCGAGTHPGGGISGRSGLNAAREILRDGGWR